MSLRDSVVAARIGYLFFDMARWASDETRVSEIRRIVESHIRTPRIGVMLDFDPAISRLFYSMVRWAEASQWRWYESCLWWAKPDGVLGMEIITQQHRESFRPGHSPFWWWHK